MPSVELFWYRELRERETGSLGRPALVEARCLQRRAPRPDVEVEVELTLTRSTCGAAFARPSSPSANDGS